jgi:hypothetical protein
LCRQIAGLEDLARIIIPDNPAHRKAFVVLWIEIKYAENQFLPSRVDVGRKYGLSRRILDEVRAKLKKMGALKRISHFNPTYGNQSGWTFATRLDSALASLAGSLKTHRVPASRPQDRLRDEQSFLFL